jgi:hypothetical protein
LQVCSQALEQGTIGQTKSLKILCKGRAELKKTICFRYRFIATTALPFRL